MFEQLPNVDWSPGAGVVWLAGYFALVIFATLGLWAYRAPRP